MPLTLEKRWLLAPWSPSPCHFPSRILMFPFNFLLFKLESPCSWIFVAVLPYPRSCLPDSCTAFLGPAVCRGGHTMPAWTGTTWAPSPLHSLQITSSILLKYYLADGKHWINVSRRLTDNTSTDTKVKRNFVVFWSYQRLSFLFTLVSPSPLWEQLTKLCHVSTWLPTRIWRETGLSCCPLLVGEKFVYIYMYYSYRGAMPMRSVNVLTLSNCLSAAKHNVGVSYCY